MTTRDPRSRLTDRSAARAEQPSATAPVREITQSLHVAIDDPFSGPEEPSDHGSHPSLALGTHEAHEVHQAHEAQEERTKVESPGARVRTPAPVRPPSTSGARATRPPPVPAGELDHVGSVLGSYKVLELLGKGGMGYVFRAEHVKLGREVALKLLRADYAKRRDAVLRFFQEAKTVNRVRHRNIVDVTDFVELADGTTFIIMELLSGQSLGKWARTGIDLPRALAVLVQICDGLAAAHHVGVVHRDLKPDNIIVVPTADGAELVKLLDFGVAKLLNRDDEDIGFQTAAGSVIGTPAYMSPEQAGGMTVDGRSDTYSLGAIMYELFCGQPMFRGRSFGEYVRKHLTEMPPPPSATVQGAGIDRRLDALIMRCLQKEPNDRYGSIAELRDALLGMLGTMETHPPMATLSGSAVRHISTILPLPLPPTSDALPTAMGTAHQLAAHAPMPSLAPGGYLPAGYAPAVGSQPLPMAPAYQYAGYSQNQSYPGYQTHGSQVVPPTGIIQPPTPWWIWCVGGAAAVGLGIGAAVWFAGTGQAPAAAAAVEPAALEARAEPIEPTAPALPAPLEIKFDSLPSGGVFAEGKSAELCHTPCTFVIDPADGGARDTRTFVVRAAGYRDSTVQVDLRGARRDYQVTLVHAEPAGLADPGPAVPEPTIPGPRAKRGAKSTRKPTRLDPKPAAAQPTAAPTPKKKPGKKAGGIDPTETLDPFQ